MGRSFLFQCARCRYRVAVAGGTDRGAHVYTETIRCRDCQELYDIPARLRVAPAELDLKQRLRPRPFLNRPTLLSRGAPGWNQRLPHGGAAKSQWVAVKLHCPAAQWHRVEKWRAPGPCPRCGQPLDGSLTPYRVWE